MRDTKGILHVIGGLEVGGAEMMLYKLVQAADKDRFTHRVVSLTDTGTVGREIEAAGVPVHSLGMRRNHRLVTAGLHLRRLIKRFRPDLVHCWMYKALVTATAATWGTGNGVPMIWGIRNTLTNYADRKLTSKLLIKLSQRLSTRPYSIVYCSEASADQHEAVGFPRSKRRVIGNGFDLNRFRPDRSAKKNLANALSVSEHSVFIGHVARYDPMKDYPTLLTAATTLVSRGHDVQFVLVGKEIDNNNRELADRITRLQLNPYVHLLGLRQDIPGIVAGLDILTMSSAWGESFPNILGEAMASGTPCLATDIGESSTIIGDTGKIVPPEDPERMAAGLTELIELGQDGRARLGGAARERVSNRYSIEAISGAYQGLYLESGSTATLV